MAKYQILCLLLLMAVIYHSTDAWLIKINKKWQEKNCFCSVVLNNGIQNVVHDMGSIVRCKEFLGCSCNHIKMRSCYANCEDAVKRWAQTSCPSHLIGQPIRAKYKASQCHNGLTRAFIVCSGNAGSSGSTGGGGGGVRVRVGSGSGGRRVRVGSGGGGGRRVIADVQQ